MAYLHIEYENYLIGSPTKVFDSFTSSGKSHKAAIQIYIYAFEKLLNWTQAETEKKADEYIFDMLKLNDFKPYFINEDDADVINLNYYLSQYYPDISHSTRQKNIVSFYKDVLSGRNSFSDKWFDGYSGFIRYTHCLRYAIEMYKPNTSTVDLYRFFTSQDGIDFLDKYKLLEPLEIGGFSILDILDKLSENHEDISVISDFFHFKEIMQ